MFFLLLILNCEIVLFGDKKSTKYCQFSIFNCENALLGFKTKKSQLLRTNKPIYWFVITFETRHKYWYVHHLKPTRCRLSQSLRLPQLFGFSLLCVFSRPQLNKSHFAPALVCFPNFTFDQARFNKMQTCLRKRSMYT